MPPFTSILCALDLSSLGERVLRHALGVAAVSGARLTVLTVFTSGDPHQIEARVDERLREILPPEARGFPRPNIEAVRVVLGQPADVVVDMARSDTDLIVAGTHSKSGLSRWLLGSTSSAILESAPCAAMLIPPGQVDIVTLGPDQAMLRPGVVLAAIDLAEQNDRQLTLASQLASMAGQPLVLMTVADAALSDADAEAALRSRAEGLSAPPARFVVRRGRVPDEIDHLAVAEGAGLVVMGLRSRLEGTPGAIAQGVLMAKDAVVLAVPRS